MAEGDMNPAHVLEKCISGEVSEANALPQLLHMHRENPRQVVAALSEKANFVVQQADAGQAAIRAGSFLVNVASFLDRQIRESEEGSASTKGNTKKSVGGQAPSAPSEVSRPLLDHILLLSGGKNRAAKDRAIRAQGCTMISALALQVPGHRAAEDKLLEFALDRVPSIREKAVRGLAGISGNSKAAELALMARTTDQCTAVRASAVRALKVSAGTAGTLLERIDDVEACVRGQLFMRLSEYPAAIAELGPAALARLIAGLSDRTSSVRSAAGQAVDAWKEHLGGGVLQLLARCDLTSDEALGEAAAAALAARYPEEGARVARLWLGQLTGNKDQAAALPDGPAPVLFARLAISSMSEDAREEVLDVPSILKRTYAVLEAAQQNDAKSAWHDYLLRQLLKVVALADICDEGVRRQVEKVAEAVLFRAPLPKTAITEMGTTEGTCRVAQSAIDLAIVIIRKVCGLVRFQSATAKHQALEARSSARVVMLLSEISNPFECKDEDAVDGGEHPFTTQLSLQIEELNQCIEKHQKTKANLDAGKKKALADEDYIQAQKIKEQEKQNDRNLAELRSERERLLAKRDSVCMRTLMIVQALLRWSNSDIRRDSALYGTMDLILKPMIQLPALSKELEVAAIYAICLFCVRDGMVAKQHWSLLLTIFRQIREIETNEARDSLAMDGSPAWYTTRARAAICARALADCARLHGQVLDRAEIISAASALSAVPFSTRKVVLEPLCGWFLSLGHMFFEEHLKVPVTDVHWALGWMLVEAFKQRRQPEELERKRVQAEPLTGQKKRGLSWVTRPEEEEAANRPKEKAQQPETEESDAIEDIAMASRLTQFFAVLPKLPGKHGAPMLSLALESIAESGLWRRGVLLPDTSDGQTRWMRNFSWPELFTFVHERVPPELRFRLWRCSLQICVNSPALAPLAEIPFALAAVAADAPPGAAELLQEALQLGADPDSLAPLQSRLPQLPEPSDAKKMVLPPVVGVGLPMLGAEGKLLLAPVDGMNAEKERREELAELGINVEAWAPADIEVPKMLPQHHKMRMAQRKGGGPRKGNSSETVESVVPAPQENVLPLPPKAEAAAAAKNQPPEMQEGPPEAKRRRVVKKQADEKVRLPLAEIS
eukprot:TRINITY_DN73164_c0_g1_i1.p1 TRINITY_DN73164_c0_g1~~TRINITY_DN73164_c0_g1_i1.p1  ORF type:complete len:1122 (-),score=271.18 TRINITY_DN73164_c0_g1_i1:193-3558(-)